MDESYEMLIIVKSKLAKILLKVRISIGLFLIDV